eukprot:TRINITY_DN618_c0_g1_i1.p1 TRINITY_DN618_c0_g1~~TRINITY_DN618_c0_g1_i1.p1  ORF type:complete len:470 (+),score=119.07 TRINITY_DN618_c0_g1_i1:93-1412(+)
MAAEPVVWVKTEGGKPCVRAVKDGKVDVKGICEFLDVDWTKPLKIGDWIPALDDNGLAEYNPNVGLGTSKTTASVIETKSVSPLIKFHIKKKGAITKYELSLKPPVKWTDFEDAFRKKSGWDYKSFELHSEGGLLIDEGAWEEHLKAEMAGRPQAEVKLIAETLDKGFSDFNTKQGLEYLSLPGNYPVAFKPEEFERAEFDLDMKAERIKDYADWTVKKLVEHFVDDIKLRMLVYTSYDLEGLELTRREMISPVLLLASLLAQKEIELRAEATVKGTLGNGAIDYTALIERVQILLTEAKKVDLKKAEGQVYAEMAASREALARYIDPSSKKRKFSETEELLEGVSTTGIRTDAERWVLSRYINSQGTKKLLESEVLKIDLQANKDVLRKQLLAVVGAIAGAMNKHILEFDSVIKTKKAKVAEEATGAPSPSSDANKDT